MNTELDTSLQAHTYLMLEHLPMGVALFDIRDLRLIAANTRYHSLLAPEWQQGRAIGHSLTEVMPRVEPSEIIGIFRRVAETGVAYQAEAYPAPTLTRGVAYWNWTLVPIYEHGQMSYLHLTVTEVTSQVVARLQAEQAHAALAQTHHEVERERQRLYTILDQLPEGVLLVEAMTGKVSYANPAAAHLLGFALPQLVGVPLNQSALLSPYGLSSQNQQSAFRWNFALIHALWGKSSTSQELPITRPDGSEIIVLSSAAPIRQSNGLISEAVIVFQDITALKQLEQQKNEFFAVASHELRTPLTIIMGLAELLQVRASNGADARHQYAITSLTQECERLSRLIHEMLDATHLAQAQLKMQKSYQDLLAPLSQIVNKHAYATRTHKLHLVLEELEPTDLLMGWFDLPRIEQVLSNLLTNAVKYSRATSEIEVGMRAYRDALGAVQEVLIWVKDQGMGIAAADLPHIFERFYRAATLDRSISGFGIGLYLTKEVVQGHGGRIWVESTEGQGSTFFVRLPLGETK